MSSVKKHILFYYPSNKQSVPMETLLIQLNNSFKYKVSGLTICEKGMLHKTLEENGIRTYTYVIPKNNKVLYYLKHIIFLIKFCKKHKVDYIHSHLQQTNIISIFSQFFTRAKVIVFRHHFRYIKTKFITKNLSYTEQIFDILINFFARVIIVPSSGVKNKMIEIERANKNKIKIIPYIYDFAKYGVPEKDAVEKIKQIYPCKLRLIMVSRLIKLKQHHVVFPIIKELTEEGLDIQLLVLDEGPEEKKLKEWIIKNNMRKYIHMLGFRTDFLNFMAASDVLIQPSLTDASNSAVKEMALLNKIVMVTENVGDYSDYIIHKKNGILLPIKNIPSSLKSNIKFVYENLNKLDYGKNLNNTVKNLFGKKSHQRVINQLSVIMENL
tara:strand:+ start:33588 stop:34733 length:1146 start_codon:yes stop_codon:yes gene_type:complete